MNIEDIREYCINKVCVQEDFPFDDVTLAFKVLDKIFAITNLESLEPSVNLKCNPEWAIELREEHSAIQPGYHMNKKHWNTVNLDGSLSNRLIKEMIDHSYDCVISGMPKRKQSIIKASSE